MVIFYLIYLIINLINKLVLVYMIIICSPCIKNISQCPNPTGFGKDKLLGYFEMKKCFSIVHWINTIIANEQ